MTLYVDMTMACGHEVEVEVKAELCDDCEGLARDELCAPCTELADDEIKWTDDDECGDCYRRNHPSLSAYERNL